MDTNTLAKVLAEALTAMQATSLRDANHTELLEEVERRGLCADRLASSITDERILAEFRQRSLKAGHMEVSNEWVLDEVTRRGLTGDVLENADDDELWEAISDQTHTVCENIGDLDDYYLLDAIDDDAKESMCREWVKGNADEARALLASTLGESVDEWRMALRRCNREQLVDVLHAIADRLV